MRMLLRTGAVSSVYARRSVLADRAAGRVRMVSWPAAP